MSRRTFWIVLAIGAALRLFLISNAGLWYDENFTLLVTRLPLSRMMQGIFGDVHPPLWYLLIWPLGRIASLPPWAIRIPSALLSIASLALYPRLMRDLRVPGRVQLIAFVMLAVLPMQLHYAQEARMYALLELLVIIASVSVIEGHALLLGLATAGLLYTQNYGLFYVVTLGTALVMIIVKEWWTLPAAAKTAHHAALAGGTPVVYYTDELYLSMARWLRLQWIRLALAMLIGVLVWLPWLPVMLRQMAFIHNNYWIFNINAGGVGYTVFQLFWSVSLNTQVGNLLGLLLTFAVITLGVWYLLTKRPASWLMLAWLASGPLLMAIIMSLLRDPIVLARPLIGITPFLYLICAFPLAEIASLRGRLFAACFILPVLMMGVADYYRYLPDQKTKDGTGNMQAAVDLITANWQTGDLILDAGGMGWINLMPYLSGYPQYALPNCTAVIPGGMSGLTHDALQIDSRRIDQLPPHKRIWFIAVQAAMSPPCETTRIETITAGHKPTLILAESKFLLSAVWLLEGE